MTRNTKEGKTAQKFADLVNDFTLDIEMVGMYLAQLTSAVLYNRLFEVFDSAKYHKENMYTREYHEERGRLINND